MREGGKEIGVSCLLLQRSSPAVDPNNADAKP